MIINLSRMEYRVRKAVGIIDTNDPDLPQADIDEYLNLSLWEVEDKMPFREKEVTSTLSTVAGTRQYTVPTPIECLREIAIVDPTTGQHSPLMLMTPQDYESVYIDDTIDTSQQDAPTNYFPESNYITVWPTPDQVYTLVIRRNTLLTDLANASDVLAIPQVWTEVIILGGVWRAQWDFGNKAGARETRKMQASLIDSITPVPVKELGDTSFAGVDVFGRDYDQRSPSSRRRDRDW